MLFCLGDGDGEEQDSLTLSQTAARDLTEKELLEEVRVVLLLDAVGFNCELGLLLGMVTLAVALTWPPCRAIKARVGVDEPTRGRGMLLEREDLRGNDSPDCGLPPAVDGRRLLLAVGRVVWRIELLGRADACPDTVCRGCMDVLLGDATVVICDATLWKAPNSETATGAAVGLSSLASLLLSSGEALTLLCPTVADCVEEEMGKVLHDVRLLIAP